MTVLLNAGQEHSGSLTGHILAQGQPDLPPTKESKRKTVIILCVVVGILLAAGLAVAAVAGGALSDLFGDLMNG